MKGVVLVALARLLLGAGCTGAGRGVRAGYAGYPGPAPWAGWGYDRIHVRLPPAEPGGPDVDPPVAAPLPEPPPSAAEPMPVPDVGMPDFGGFDAVPMDF